MADATLTGPVFRPGQDGYDTEVSGFQTAYTHRPALVVGAAGAGDVQCAVREAAWDGSPVAVQATGHGLSAAARDGVLITTRRMDGIRIDPRARTARVEAGVRSGALVAAAAEHGLAPLNGSSPSVGVVGYTLGGGIGLLARRHGYAAEHVRAVEMVTAGGELRRLEPGDELFGAVLGGGGNFGVVTALETALVPVRTVFGGQLMFDGTLLEDALEAWRAVTAAAPDGLTSSAAMLAFPDIPQVPEPLRGRYAVSFRLVYDGPQAEGERLAEPLRKVGPRIRDDLRALPYRESASIHSDPDDPHAYAATNALLGDLTDGGVRAVLDAAGPASPLPLVVDIRHLGGALARRGPSGIAVDHRDARYAVRAIGGDGEQARGRLAALREALEPWTVGHHLNFLYGRGAGTGEAQTRAGYDPATYARLAALKAVHDPGNMFRFNRNIAPAAS